MSAEVLEHVYTNDAETAERTAHQTETRKEFIAMKDGIPEELVKTKEFIDADRELQKAFKETAKRLQDECRDLIDELDKNPGAFGKVTKEELAKRRGEVKAKLAEFAKNFEPHLLAILAAWNIQKYPKAVGARFMQKLNLDIATADPRGKGGSQAKPDIVGAEGAPGSTRVRGYTIELGPAVLSSGHRLEYELMYMLQYALVQNADFPKNPDALPLPERKFNLGVLEKPYTSVYSGSTKAQNEILRYGLVDLRNYSTIRLLGREATPPWRSGSPWAAAVAALCLGLNEQATTEWFTGKLTHDEFYKAMDKTLAGRGVKEARTRRLLMDLAMQHRVPERREGYFTPYEEVFETWAKVLRESTPPMDIEKLFKDIGVPADVADRILNPPSKKPQRKPDA